jgi:hypothetical protein
VTEKQAYEILRNTPIRAKDNHTEYSRALHIALGALVKITPRKPYIEKFKLDDFVGVYIFCPDPDCRKKFMSRVNGEWNIDNTPDYCPQCGQALLWGGDAE